MKNLFFLITVLFSLLTVSCSKDSDLLSVEDGVSGASNKAADPCTGFLLSTPEGSLPFTVTPALVPVPPDTSGITSFSSTLIYGAWAVRGYVGTTTYYNNPVLFARNITYTIAGNPCTNKLRITYLSNYSNCNKPTITYSSLTGFSVSGGANYTYQLLPVTHEC
jgi:hypothetical protein